MSGKPLHVQVAEALGCAECYEHDDFWFCSKADLCVNHPHDGPRGSVLDYEHDWSATGLLLERFDISLTSYLRSPSAGCTAHVVPDGSPRILRTGVGETPLIAVCNLILALHAAGKLK